MEVSSQQHALGALPPGKNPGTQRTTRRVSPRADLDVREAKNSYLCRDENPGPSVPTTPSSVLLK
jgi:hypothetical protein